MSARGISLTPWWITLEARQARGEAAKLTWLGVWTVVGQASLVASIFFLGKGLSQEQFGLFTFALAIQTYFLSLGSGGVGVMVMRAGLRRPEAYDSAVTSYFVVTLLRSLGLVLLATLIVTQLPLASAEKFLLIMFFWGTVIGGINGQSLLDMQGRQASSSLITCLGELATTAVLAYVWHSGDLSLWWAGSIFAAKWMLTSAGRLLFYHLVVRPIRFQYSSQLVRDVWSNSWRWATSGMVMGIPFNAGVILLLLLRGPDEAAVLGLAQCVVNGLLLVCSLSHRMLQPKIVGPQGLTVASQTKVWLFAVAFHLAILALATAGSALGIWWWFGSEYAGAITALLLLLPSVAVTSLAMIGLIYLAAWEKESDSMQISLITAGVYLLGSLVIVPYFSVFGASAMTAIATICRVVTTFRKLQQASGKLRPPLASRMFRLATICCVPFWLIQSICELFYRRQQLEKRRVLLLVTNQLTARYVRQIAESLTKDQRIKLFLARAPLVDRAIPLSAILQGGLEQPVSFLRALWSRWDLVITAEHYPSGLFHPRTKIARVTHGIYSGKIIEGEDYAYGHRALRFWGSPTYEYMFAAGVIERNCAGQQHAQLTERIKIVGDPVLEDLLQINHRREFLRREMQLESKRVVLVMSSWGKNSLIQRHGDFLVNELTVASLESTQWILSLHPNNYTRGPVEKTRSLISALQKRGVRVLSASEDWRPYLAMADMAVSDFTSLSIYFAQLGRPLIYFDRYTDLLVEGGPLHQLQQLCPNRQDFVSLAEAIQFAETQYPIEDIFRLNRQIAVRSGASQRLNKVLYSALQMTLRAEQLPLDKAA